MKLLKPRHIRNNAEVVKKLKQKRLPLVDLDNEVEKKKCIKLPDDKYKPEMVFELMINDKQQLRLYVQRAGEYGLPKLFFSFPCKNGGEKKLFNVYLPYIDALEEAIKVIKIKCAEKKLFDEFK